MTDYIYNKISKEEVKEIISSKDTSRHMQYKGSYGKAYKEIMDETEPEIPEENKIEKNIKEDVIKGMANDMVTQLKDNLQSESKKVYPKAVAHKHGK